MINAFEIENTTQTGNLCNAQITSPALKSDTIFKNNLGVSISKGAVFDKEATFGGLSVGYVRVLNEKWSISPSLSFDQENDHIPSIENPKGKLSKCGTF